ncbi:external alternative NAD(P)H-ubiquinone oxidoreductase B1, mitochondrial-like [Malania oleifera]|uniref:external alternative NAD(P)H-ubiquinone oxidoreductase B1, mitochondrial-like n=1 Tax=Malania oleifera TaxID=397392 RepID=UPI0025AECCB5|nr:external alternative NAD(P)H-ubiquinone oxidoreductase B1, mitochondrial-like [Malania oleifera]
MNNGGGVMAYSEMQAQQQAPTIEHDQNAKPKKKRVVVLGTGWAGVSFLKNLDLSLYDVQVVSPHNYFAFTPLLPSVTCGTVEPRSIVEPIRSIMKKKIGEFQYWEAECVQINAAKKEVLCRSVNNSDLVRSYRREFNLKYDYLVIALGAQANTTKTTGVMEHCHFIKEIEDAKKIRKNVIDSFERAVLPNISEEEMSKILHFVVVGGGPSGVAFAAELHDFVMEDLVKLYPMVKDHVKITLIHSNDHILNTFDQRISSFAEQKFKRDGIEVITGCHVRNVSDKEITLKEKSTKEVHSKPYGIIVWSTGVGIRPVIREFMKQINQQDNTRALVTDEWLRVKGCEDVYAIGDCATIEQRKVMEDILSIFKAADEDNSGTLTVKEFERILDDVCARYPQVDLYLKTKPMRNLFKDSKGSDKVISLEEFKVAISQADLKTKSLPSIAQVAAQQGAYLSQCFNRMEKTKDKPEGPLRFEGSGRHQFRPFRYKHFLHFVSMGTEPVTELPGDKILEGHNSRWLWHSVYAIGQVSWRTRILVISDWIRKRVSGRDTSGI